MPRFDRPKFNICELNGKSAEAQARLLFDWWCDDADRELLLDSLAGKVVEFNSRSHVEDDPAPPRSAPAKQGHAGVALITDPKAVAWALASPANFKNVPYAELGGASFMLALDPGAGHAGVDWHQEQRDVATDLLGRFARPQLDLAAELAVTQAAILSLRDATFDLAEFAEQAALRYFGLVFGYGAADHVLLEDAARRGYRALQYLIVGRHFVSEPGTLPAAQQALGRLATRTACLMDEYATLQRAPRKPYRPGTPPANARWPVGVQPWSELNLSTLGSPALKLLPGLARRLNGQDLCNLVGGLLVGMVGNVQTSLCLMVRDLMKNHHQDPLQPPSELTSLKNIVAIDAAHRNKSKLNLLLAAKAHQTIGQRMMGLLARNPPVPFLPRRTAQAVTVGGVPLPADRDCILALRPSGNHGCPWGAGAGNATHACLGVDFVQPLLVALLKRVLALPELEEQLDAVTGEVLKPERLWGFGCTRYRLRHRRDRVRVQQPLIVIMRVKSPIAENAERLRQIIRSGAPRIDWLLKGSMVHMAWFEFMEQDTLLALRTVYDGDFDAYILHFALAAGELFDQLFEHIEGGPPMPVAEHPYEFVETIRRYNRSPLGGYFFCAYPDKKVQMITGTP